MANEFYARKGLAIATASVATASGATQATKYLVVGDDSIVRWATASTAGSGISGTSGLRGATGATGATGSNGTSGTSGTNPVQGATYLFDSNPDPYNSIGSGGQGGFAYWQETNLGNTALPQISSTNGGALNLLFVNKIQITKSSLAPENLYLWDWFKSFNGIGGGTYLYNNIPGYSSTSPTPNVPYSYSSTLTKGYLRIRSSTDNTYNLFKVVGMGYYAPGGGGSPTVFTSMTSTTAGYYLAALDGIADNGGTDPLTGIINIYVDYVGSTSQTSPSDSENCFIDFSTSLATMYNQVIVADPKWSFQINDGSTPANLAAFGVAQFSSNSLYLNNSSNLLSGTSSVNNTLVGFNTGKVLSTGKSNTFIGASAGSADTTGSSNTFIGNLAGNKNNSGSDNVFIGDAAGFSNQAAVRNVFIGSGAGYLTNVATYSNRNVFLGYGSGAFATSSVESTLIGYGAGITSNNLEQTTFIGAYAGSNAATGSNTFIGAFSGFQNTTGSLNLYVGNYSGANGLTGMGNTFVGNNTGFGPTAGYSANFNTFIGNSAGVLNIGDENTFIGAYSGISNTTGSVNLFIGIRAGASNSTGQSNTYLGNAAGSLGTTASFVTAIGPQAGFNNRVDGNTFIGVSSGRANTTGTNNFFLGGQSGYLNTIGSFNTFLGLQSGYSNSIGGASAPGQYNTFIGNQAGYSNISGSFNTYIGVQSGYSARLATRNTYIGQYSGSYVDGGAVNIIDNTYIGYNAGAGPGVGLNNNGLRNTFIGSRTGENNRTGNENTFIGFLSGSTNVTGSNNTYIGTRTGAISDFSNSIAIGAYATPTANNQLVIASSTVQIGTASSGVFSHYLNVKVNGIDLKIPLYY